MNDLPVRTAIGNPENLVQGLAVGEFDGGIVELAPYYKIDGSTFVERPLRQSGNVWAHEGDLQSGIGSLHRRCKPDIPLEAWRAGEQHQEVEAPANLDGLFRAHMMRRRVEHARAFQHSRRISQPHRVPIGLNLAGGWPTRAGTAVVILKRRWIQEQRL